MKKRHAQQFQEKSLPGIKANVGKWNFCAFGNFVMDFVGSVLVHISSDGERAK